MSRPNLWHDADSWQAHAISRQPVSDDTVIRVQYRGGHISQWEYTAKQLNWKQRGLAFDIAGYQIVKKGGE